MPPTLVIHFLSFLFINTITKKRGEKNHHFEEKKRKENPHKIKGHFGES